MFDQLIQAMVQAQFMSLPEFTKPFIIEYDDLGKRLGAMLMQKQNPIAYFSQSLTKKEQLKLIYEHELMKIMLAVQRWQHYLLGRKFNLRTNQKSLKYLLEQREVNLEYQKWLYIAVGVRVRYCIQTWSGEQGS